jgi:hypothetical protein
MVQLLRQLPKDLWAQYRDSPLWAAGDCPPKILENLVQKNGLSMWAIATGWDVRRTLSAIAVAEMSIRDCLFTLVEEQEIRALGIEVKHTQPETVDPEVSKSHRDLVNVSGQQIVKLAKLIMQQPPKACDKEEIFESAYNYFKMGVFNKHKFAEVQKKKQGTVIETFMKRGILDFV